MKNFKTLFLLLTALSSLLPAALSAQMTWHCQTASAPWTPRWGQSLIVFHDTMWLLGGYDGYPKNDVWYSTDGSYWELKTYAQWSQRLYHTSIVFDNKMWVIGGLYWNGSAWSELNDVWWSANGFDWSLACSTARWLPRGIHTSVVFHDSIWIMGGATADLSIWFNDVWKSTDGDSWLCATGAAPWPERFGHTSVVFHDSMWIIGGSDCDDVWHSYDGNNWTRTESDIPWGIRYTHTSVVFKDTIWLMSGCIANTILNDIWFSPDGDSWKLAEDSAEWLRRSYASSVVYNNQMWILAGNFDFSSGLNDVWYSIGLGIKETKNIDTQSIDQTPTILRGELNLNLQSEITLFDITGRKVADLKASANNIRHLSPGVYFIRRNNNLVTKIIVTR